MAKKKPQSNKKQRDKELLSIKKTKGVLTASSVVAYAKDPKTALHSAFEWDDTKAAYAHRLWQARELIVSVQIIHEASKKTLQAFVSLKSDRKSEGGGYRDTIRVLSSKQLREEFLAQALADFLYWQQKYQGLKELVPIFEAAAKVRRTKKRK